MEVLLFLVFATLSLCTVVHGSLRAEVRQVLGYPRSFSGENIQLRCSISNTRSNWTYSWFKDDSPIYGQDLLKLWNVNLRQSGKYSCQAFRDTLIGPIRSQKSLPLHIEIDGGWVILQVSTNPVIVGETLQMTCLIRNKIRPQEVALYRDGVEVLRQTSPHLQLHNISLADQGMYECSANWDKQRQSYSANSVSTQVNVLEVLSEPVVEVDLENPVIPPKMMRLTCHVQFNFRNVAPPISYYFYKNGHKLVPSTSENNIITKQSPGLYSCKVRVPMSDLVRLGQATPFGAVTAEHRQLYNSALQPRAFAPMAPAFPTHPLPPEEPPRPTALPKPFQPEQGTSLSQDYIQPTQGQIAPPDDLPEDVSGDSPYFPSPLPAV